MPQAVRWSVLDRMPKTQRGILGGLMLYLIDTDKIKNSLFVSLLSQGAKCLIYIYGYDPASDNQEGLHDELVSQLTAERQIRNWNGKLVWEQIRKDNHYLDCLMLGMACGDVSWTPLSLHHYLMQVEATERRQVACPQNTNSSNKTSKRKSR